MTNIRKGDTVQIIRGNDRGKQGKVLGILRDRTHIVVEGVNMHKKHVRARRQGQKGEIIHIPASFPVARAMLYCSHCKKGVRVGFLIDETRGKTRICKKCAAAI